MPESGYNKMILCKCVRQFLSLYVPCGDRDVCEVAMNLGLVFTTQQDITNHLKLKI